MGDFVGITRILETGNPIRAYYTTHNQTLKFEMLRTEERIQIDVDLSTSHLHLSFERHTERTIFDICDLNGRILKTGPVAADYIQIPIEELAADHYVLLILDGDRVYSQKFSVAR